jgi:hypothetical protein
VKSAGSSLMSFPALLVAHFRIRILYQPLAMSYHSRTADNLRLAKATSNRSGASFSVEV